MKSLMNNKKGKIKSNLLCYRYIKNFECIKKDKDDS